MRWVLKNIDAAAVDAFAAELATQPSLDLKNSQLAATVARLSATPAAVTERLAKLFAAGPTGR